MAKSHKIIEKPSKSYTAIKSWHHEIRGLQCKPDLLIGDQLAYTSVNPCNRLRFLQRAHKDLRLKAYLHVCLELV